MTDNNVTELPKKSDQELKLVQEAAVAERKVQKDAKIAEKLSGYPMRELQADDLFLVLEIAERLNLADMVIEFFEQRDKAAIKADQVKGFALIAAENTQDINKVEEMQSKVANIQKELSESSFEIIGKIIKLVLSNIKVIRKELNQLLANLTNKQIEDIDKMNLVTYTLLIKAFFAKPELKELSELLF